MWFNDDSQYVIEDGLGERSWPLSLSLVHVYERTTEEGKTEVVTTSGWSKKDFMTNYTEGKFAPKGYLRRFQYGRAFGFIMRALPLVCIDIDGKNNGLVAARVLQLPPTLAERSKSGNGYHLFYRLPNASWDDQYGYAEYGDTNGLVPGVDVRGVGIVYHYPGQRWNTRAPALLSPGMTRLLDAREHSRKVREENNLARRQEALDPEDRVIFQEELLEQLARPLPSGMRNSGLYAWGCRADGILPTWEADLTARARQIDLDEDEITRIITNVRKYGNGSGA